MLMIGVSVGIVCIHQARMLDVFFEVGSPPRDGPTAVVKNDGGVKEPASKPIGILS